jgi:hypothetical protein
VAGSGSSESSDNQGHHEAYKFKTNIKRRFTADMHQHQLAAGPGGTVSTSGQSMTGGPGDGPKERRGTVPADSKHHFHHHHLHHHHVHYRQYSSSPNVLGNREQLTSEADQDCE